MLQKYDQSLQYVCAFVCQNLSIKQKVLKGIEETLLSMAWNISQIWLGCSQTCAKSFEAPRYSRSSFHSEILLDSGSKLSLSVAQRHSTGLKDSCLKLFQFFSGRAKGSIYEHFLIFEYGCVWCFDGVPKYECMSEMCVDMLDVGWVIRVKHNQGLQTSSVPESLQKPIAK